MAQQHYRTPFKKALLQFITEPDPFLAMLKWVMTEMMRIEAAAMVGAVKGKHSSDRTTYFSGARARRVDTRMGTVYLLVPKVRKGGYVPFFVSERGRSEQALRKKGYTYTPMMRCVSTDDLSLSPTDQFYLKVKDDGLPQVKKRLEAVKSQIGELIEPLMKAQHSE